MEKNGKDVDGEKIGGKNKVVSGLGTPKVVLNGKIEEDDDDELKSLLLPPSRGGLLKKPGNPRRKVQWNDTNGNKLAEILEYQPSSIFTEGKPGEERDDLSRGGGLQLF
ncbi:hypothetical protein RJ639_028140 [Escallonia herrerae]|uniref:Uncharacterized protein n=1 Tax=Escallonia herrerae TaxID=1293975 RepID=A0AA89BP20_9ASTE|nr:hypothetical protein RJ639_028140 [Escallonia herrerae]